MEVQFDELLVEQLVSLLSSTKLPSISMSDDRKEDNVPLETAYTVQNLGVRTDIFADRPLSLLKMRHY